MENKIKVVIADDHAIFRQSLELLLASEGSFEVIGAASNGTETLEVIRRTQPQVLLLDLFMPEGNGFEVLRLMDREAQNVATVVLTASDNHTDYLQVVRLGARGLVLKGDDPGKLFAAIRTVASGELSFPSEIAQQVLTAMSGQTKEKAPSIRRLSARERQIASLVASGFRNRDIADQWEISENTVKRHLQSIFDKTGAHDRLELAVMALNDQNKAA